MLYIYTAFILLYVGFSVKVLIRVLESGQVIIIDFLTPKTSSGGAFCSTPRNPLLFRLHDYLSRRCEQRRVG